MHTWTPTSAGWVWLSPLTQLPSGGRTQGRIQESWVRILACHLLPKGLAHSDLSLQGHSPL